MLDATPLVLRSSSLNRALAVLGDWWTVLILREAFLGVTGFERFRERLGVPRQTLANRLRALVENGLFYQRETAVPGARHAYKLTAKGLDLYPHVLMAWRWEQRWTRAAVRELPGTLVHARCGRATTPELACAHCRAPVLLADVAYEPGPGVGADAPGTSAPRRSLRVGRIPSAQGRAGVATSVYILADRWAHLILGAVFLGARSFEALASNLGIASNILTHRLGVLVRAKFLEKVRSREDARRFEYRLTDRGRDVFPITLSLVRWADRWLPNPRGPAMLRTHRPCGARLHVEVACSACGEPLKPWEVRFALPGRRGAATRAAGRAAERATESRSAP